MRNKPLARKTLAIAIAVVVGLQGSGLGPSPAHAQQPTPAGGPTSASARAQVGQQRFERLLSLVQDAGEAAILQDPSNLWKLDSHLQDLLVASLGGGDVAAAAQLHGLRVVGGQGVLVDIYVNGGLQAAADELGGLGMDVRATNAGLGGVVEGYMPVNAMVAAAGSPSTRAFLPVVGYGVNTGSVTSEGDGAHNGPQARALGTTGAGVVVGIISDSINQVGNGIYASQLLGDLPGSVYDLLDSTNSPIDEGRAMAEIIYDEAPGITTMYFSSGATGPVAKATSIANLVSDGVELIADDTFYITEPFFQDGIIAQSVDNAFQAGVGYFVSAGNRGRLSYEQDFRDTAGDPFHDHDFDPGAGTDNLQTIGTVPDGACIWAALQWDDPWGAATHDFDWQLVNASTLALLDSSTDSNATTGFPFEFVSWCNSTGSALTVADQISNYGKSNGGDTSGAFLKYIANPVGWWTSSISEYDTASDTIDPDAASAKGAMTVAAVNWNESGLNDAAYYSSRGPVTRLFDTTGTPLDSPEVRQKPDIAAADCVSTSNTFTGNQRFGYPGFFCGTSAASPSMAGVAALVLSLRPNLGVQQLYWVLANANNTNDCTAGGNPDTECGYGFSLADMAVAWAKRARAADFTGIGVSNIVVYSGGAWQFYNFSTGDYVPGDSVWTGDSGGCIPAPMDYNGDGKVEFTQLCGNAWHFYDDDGSYNKGIWIGLPGAVPVPGDYNGDGTDDVVAFDGGAWQHYDFTSGAYVPGSSVWTGLPGGAGKPAAMDYNGDGKDDPTILAASGAWHFYNDDGSYNKGIWTGGTAGDLPVPADYNGDGTEQPVVFSGGAWQFFDFATGLYDAASSVWTGAPAASGSGLMGPAPLDYNGDGALDFTYYAGGAWHFYNADGGYNKGIWTGGTAGDKAISRRQLP